MQSWLPRNIPQRLVDGAFVCGLYFQALFTCPFNQREDMYNLYLIRHCFISRCFLGSVEELRGPRELFHWLSEHF